MQTLKVAPVLAGAPVGGAENFYTRWVVEMHKRSGFNIEAFTRPNEFREQKFSDAGVDAQLFRFGGSLDLLDHWRYRRALRSAKPDVVVTFMNRATALTPPGPYKLVARLGHYYDLKYYRHCDHWIGITQGICQHLIEGGMPPERVHHIPNFVDEVPAAALPRDSFNTPTDQPLLLAFGRLHVNKAFDILLHALASLKTGVLWLAGSGPEEQSLRDLADQLGISDRVRFLGWRNDINALLATADLFICPSRSEGLGSILLESWFHGCPVIAASSQGPSEIITDERNGLLVPVDDSQSLGSAIERLIANPGLAAKLARQGRDDYAEQYSVEKIIGQYQQLFNQLCAE